MGIDQQQITILKYVITFNKYISKIINNVSRLLSFLKCHCENVINLAILKFNYYTVQQKRI